MEFVKVPISFTYDSENNLLNTVAEGEISLEDLLDYRKRLLDYDTRKGLLCICDYSKAHADLGFEDIQKLSLAKNELKDKYDWLKIAIVVSSNVMYGMARMYHALLKDGAFDVRIFHDMESAREWLGVG